MNSYVIVDTVYSVVYLLCLATVLYVFTSPLFTSKWARVFVAASYVVTMLILQHVTWQLSNFTAYFIGSCVSLVVMLIVERGNAAAKWLYASFFFAIRWLLPSIVSTVERYTVYDWLVQTTSAFYLALVWTIEYAILTAVFCTICYTLNRFLTRISISWRSAVILCIPAVVSSISFFLVKVLQQQELSLTVEGMLALYYVALLCIMLVFVRLYVQQEQAKYALAQQATLHAQMQHVEQMERAYAEMATFKHDLHNHFNVIEQLIEKQHVADARSYMNELQQAVQLPELLTGHAVTDVILQEKMQRAKQLGIELYADFYVPKRLHIELFDLSVVLNNLLDNAIEATQHCEEKTIALSCTRQHDVFVVHVKNPITTPLHFQNGLPRSTKGSGIGLLNVQATLEKYGGHVQFHEENGFVTVSAPFIAQNEPFVT